MHIFSLTPCPSRSTSWPHILIVSHAIYCFYTCFCYLFLPLVFIPVLLGDLSSQSLHLLGASFVQANLDDKVFNLLPCHQWRHRTGNWRRGIARKIKKKEDIQCIPRGYQDIPIDIPKMQHLLCAKCPKGEKREKNREICAGSSLDPCPVPGLAKRGDGKKRRKRGAQRCTKMCRFV